MKLGRWNSDQEATSVINLVDGHDFTADLPDELLARIFRFLRSGGDRKSCSIVCRRWLRVEGESRHRLSLNAKPGLLSSIPSIFTRFDSITRLSLYCDQESASVSDEALVLISMQCTRLKRLKLVGCRELTDLGIAAFAANCRTLRKFYCDSCFFGTKGINAVINHCINLEDISIIRLRGINDGADPVGPGAAAQRLRSICLMGLICGKSFAPLLIGAKNLKTLMLVGCPGDWGDVLHALGHRSNSGLVEVHLVKISVSDVGISDIANCKGVERLFLLPDSRWSNAGLIAIAENFKLLTKLYIGGDRRQRIGDGGLVAVARHCVNLTELVLVRVDATHSSLVLIASNCKSLERLGFYRCETIGDVEISCIATKCEALRTICIRGCPISDLGIQFLALGCPNLTKIKLRKCEGVTDQIAGWLKEQRGSLEFSVCASFKDNGV